MERDVLIVPALRERDEVPDGSRSMFGVEFEVQVSGGGGDAGVAGEFDAFGFEHVFFVGHDCAVAGGIGREAGGGEGCGGLALVSWLASVSELKMRGGRS